MVQRHCKGNSPKIITALWLLLLMANFAFGQSKYPPRNEVHKDSSLTTFICKLQYAIFKKDKDFLLSVVDTNIKNSFGGDDGIEEFKEMWNIDNPNSDIWFYLSKLISLGGVFYAYSDTISPNGFLFPYVCAIELPDTLNVFTTMIVTATNVNVREKPDDTSKIVGQFNYDIVTVDYDKSYPEFEFEEGEKLKHVQYYGEKEWYYVSSLDKKICGYVHWEYIWGCVDYRLILYKIDGIWKITCLISGD